MAIENSNSNFKERKKKENAIKTRKVKEKIKTHLNFSRILKFTKDSPR